MPRSRSEELPPTYTARPPVDPPANSNEGRPTAAQLNADIDSGRTADKNPALDPSLAPLGTDDEAAGTPPTPFRVMLARRLENLIDGCGHRGERPDLSPIAILSCSSRRSALLVWYSSLGWSSPRARECPGTSDVDAFACRPGPAPRRQTNSVLEFKARSKRPASSSPTAQVYPTGTARRRAPMRLTRPCHKVAVPGGRQCAHSSAASALKAIERSAVQFRLAPSFTAMVTLQERLQRYSDISGRSRRSK